jgi:acetylornithine deacetylase
LASSTESRVLKAVDDGSDEIVRFLRDLIRAKSVTGFEQPAQELVREKLREMGAEVDYWRPSRADFRGFESFVPVEEGFRGRPNVVGRFRGRRSGGALAFNGHVDVVPEGDPKLWKHDPYGGYVERGRMYGRGACDMKGGLAAIVFAVRALQEAGVPLIHDVLVESVVGEESGGVGTLAAILRGYVPAAAIVAEPTNLELLTSQAGCLNFRLTISGKAAHGASRYLGVSAVEKFQPILGALNKLEEKRSRMKKLGLYARVSNPVPLSIGKVRAGNWNSTVPDELMAEGRYGVWPGESPEHARMQFEDAVEGAARKDLWLRDHAPEVGWLEPHWEPAEIPHDHWLALILDGSARIAFRRRPRRGGSTAGTDMRLFTNVSKIPAILYGPGDDSVSHFRDEYVSLKDVINACKVYALAALAWSRRAQPA